VIGGTSAVAPLWAGLIALINESMGKPVGFVNPLLYQNASTAADFNSITSGNNGAYSAGPGWDACTGLGIADRDSSGGGIGRSSTRPSEEDGILGAKPSSSTAT
jgi:subtilase family serine protease